MSITLNPPGLPMPTIQVLFRGLLVFRPASGGKVRIGVHHAALDHAVRVSIETTPAAETGLPSEFTFLPDSAGSNDIELDVKDPHPRYPGINEYPGSVPKPDSKYYFSQLLRFRSLPGHTGAIEESAALPSEIVLNSGYFFSAENLDVIKALQTERCETGDEDRVSVVAAANVYVADRGKAILKYVAPGGNKEKEFLADGTTYKIEITNLPPEGMFGHANHFRFYYLAFSGVSQRERRDICPRPLHRKKRGKRVTHQHPCVPVGGS